MYWKPGEWLSYRLDCRGNRASLPTGTTGCPPSHLDRFWYLMGTGDNIYYVGSLLWSMEWTYTHQAYSSTRVADVMTHFYLSDVFFMQTVMWRVVHCKVDLIECSEMGLTGLLKAISKMPLSQRRRLWVAGQQHVALPSRSIFTRHGLLRFSSPPYNQFSGLDCSTCDGVKRNS
jgi:hypothetical protein